MNMKDVGAALKTVSAAFGIVDPGSRPSDGLNTNKPLWRSDGGAAQPPLGSHELGAEDG
jgi:hypothetical protein